MDRHPIGTGEVFVMTRSVARGTYPDSAEAAMRASIEQRLRDLGYQISTKAGSADFIFMADWGVESAGVSSYQRIGDTVYAGSDFVHYVAGQFLVSERGAPGAPLWEARNTEVWGHAKVDTGRMASVLMQKFPN